MNTTTCFCPICWSSSGCDLTYRAAISHTYFIAALQVKSQPEDGQHIGPKHVVVDLLYY